MFTDSDFSFNDALYWADYPTEAGAQVSKLESRISWKRAIDEFPNNPFWGSDGITPLDMVQGALGNCWFTAMASAMAEKPKRLESLFVNQGASLNKNGAYAVNLYALGVPHTVVVDDYLPLQEQISVDGSTDYVTLFALVGADKSMWGTILEKAMAKLSGNYQHLIAGDSEEAGRALMGSPSLQ